MLINSYLKRAKKDLELIEDIDLSRAISYIKTALKKHTEQEINTILSNLPYEKFFKKLKYAIEID